MKWVPMVEKVKGRVKFSGLRWLPVLMAIVTLILMAGASNKWTG